MRILGMNSGTSIDGIDIALCEFQPSPTEEGTLLLRLLAYQERAYPDDLRQRILGLCQEKACRLDELAELHVRLGQAFGRAALAFLDEHTLDRGEIDLIASHGQTVYHLVEEGRDRATLQLGEAAIIAYQSGITTIADFRVADVAAGGQGAPLSSFLDALLCGDSHNTRALQNIGGIGNVTFLPAGTTPQAAYAFDTGPGNVLIDYGARYFSRGSLAYDKDGILARNGRIDEQLLSYVLSHAYFQQSPPKTTGRELFGDTLAAEIIRAGEERQLSPADIMATLTAITARSITLAYRQFGPPHLDEVLVSGGGAYNPILMHMLQESLPEVTVTRFAESGLPAEAKEAVLFALLAHENIHGRPGNLPRCTGATKPVVLGKVIPGLNYQSLFRNIGQVRQSSVLQRLKIADR